MNPVGRNEPCPCGSGKRYKDCHGALAQPKRSGQWAPDAWIPPTMRKALHAQQEGQVVAAAEGYRRVLAADPSNFDALHMLALVEYEIGRYDEAITLMKRAIEIRPDLGSARQNLQLLQSLPRMESEICRDVLPRIVARIDTGFDVTRLACGLTVHIVTGRLGRYERASLAAILIACGATPVKRWREPAIDPPADVEAEHAIRLSAENHPRGGWIVLLGPVRSPAAWLPAAEAHGVILVATRDEPCALIDRIDEIAAAGYARPVLLCATPALAHRLGLPPDAVPEVFSDLPASQRDA